MKDATVSSVSPHISAREAPQKPPDVSVPGPPWLTGAAGGRRRAAAGGADGTESRAVAARSHSCCDTFIQGSVIPAAYYTVK